MKKVILLLSFLQASYCQDDVGKDTVVANSKRDKRLFSLFAVVTFPNDECTTVSDSTMKGTCMSSTECADSKGTTDGHCASGFGVCCVYTLYACGGTVSKNCTYIGSPSYPTTYTTSGTCTYSITPLSTDICKIRLDFDYFVSNIAPVGTGACSTGGDYLYTSGPTLGTTTGHFPPLCGKLTGQHIYSEQAMSSTATSLAFTVGTSSTGFTYKIKVTQIECSSLMLPPHDCAQWFTGISGHVSSLNYPTAMLSTSNYGICFRQEEGYCGMEYGPHIIAAGTDAFSLASGLIGSETTACSAAYIAVPNMRSTSYVNQATAPIISTGIICGDVLSSQDRTPSARGDGTVVQTASPFMFQVRTNSATTGTVISTGFNIAYTQMACTGVA